jgi:hypothetical protein
MSDANAAGGEAPSGPMTDDQAIAALASLDADDDPVEETTEKPGKASGDEAESDEADADEADGSAEHQPESDEAEAEDEDPGDADDQAEEQSSVIGDDTKVELPDGAKVALKELKQGYLRQQDYTRKTQELGNDRKAARQLIDQLNGYAPAIIERLQLADGLVQYAMPKPPPQEMRDTDPVGYMDLKDRYQEAMADFSQRVQAIREGMQGIQGINSAHSQILTAEELANARERLREILPDLNDAKKAPAIKAKVAAAAKRVGFKAEDIDTWTDPRLVHLAYLANRALALDEAKPKVAKKVEGKSPVAKPGQRPNKGGSDKQLEYARTMKRLRATGSGEDAVKALSLLDD